MNADRLFNMVVGRLLRRFMRFGMNSGIDRISGKRTGKARRRPPRSRY